MKMVEKFLVCPKCFEKTEYNDAYVLCSKCHMNYSIINGIPIMLPDKYDKKVTGKSNNIDTHKDYVIDFYSQVSENLESYGRFIKFMNCGYAINENTQYSVIDLKKGEMIERSSVKLLLEVVGNIDCDGKKIIEIGCGRGGNIYHLHKYYKPEFMIGIDICLENIIFCDKRKHENSFFFVADAEDLPFASESFDIVINIESSFHYPDILKFYRNVDRILKRGGYFMYADALPIHEFREMEILFDSMNYEVIRNQNITSNVLLSFENMATALTKKHPNEVLSFYDSTNYKKMKEGEAEYRIYVVKKNSSD